MLAIIFWVVTHQNHYKKDALKLEVGDLKFSQFHFKSKKIQQRRTMIFLINWNLLLKAEWKEKKIFINNNNMILWKI